MVYQIAVAVVTLAVLIFLIYCIKTLRSIDDTVKELRKMGKALEVEVHDVLHESKRFLQETTQFMQESTQLVKEVRQKGQKLESIVQGIEQISHRIQEVAVGVVKKAEEQQDRLGNLLSLFSSGVQLFKQWKKEKE